MFFNMLFLTKTFSQHTLHSNKTNYLIVGPMFVKHEKIKEKRKINSYT